MNNVHDVAEIIQGLLAKTRKGTAPWLEATDLMAALYPSYVTLSLPRSSVVLYKERGATAITFKVLNQSGTAIIELVAGSDHTLYSQLRDLLVSAIRHARKVDQTLEDLDKFLNS